MLVLLSFHSNVSLIMPFVLIREFSTLYIWLEFSIFTGTATLDLVGEGLKLLLGELLDSSGDDEPVLVSAGDQLDVLEIRWLGNVLLVHKTEAVANLELRQVIQRNHCGGHGGDDPLGGVSLGVHAVLGGARLHQGGGGEGQDQDQGGQHREGGAAGGDGTAGGALPC